MPREHRCLERIDAKKNRCLERIEENRYLKRIDA